MPAVGATAGVVGVVGGVGLAGRLTVRVGVCVVSVAVTGERVGGLVRLLRDGEVDCRLVVHHPVALRDRLGLRRARLHLCWRVALRQDVGQGDLAEFCVDDRRVAVELAHEHAHKARLLCADTVELVEHHHVRRLHLLDQQVDDGAVRRGHRRERHRCELRLVIRHGLLEEVWPLAQLLNRVELLGERGGVHHRHHPCEAHGLHHLEARGLRVLEGIADEARLSHARRLDQDMVVARSFHVGERDELAEGAEELVARRTADAPVLQLHHVHLRGRAGSGARRGRLSTCARGGGRTPFRRAAPRDELGVDVDGSHIVDEYTHAAALAVLEHVLEQRGLPRAEEPRE
mmetsp:Transcript_28379/g.65214  ORF Transcript_28379/g.65214 Transcript_28379/m.65214 type:complete len:345 (-) Transcript_28379:196-1230(-)